MATLQLSRGDVLHYDKVFKGAKKLTRHHWSIGWIEMSSKVQQLHDLWNYRSCGWELFLVQSNVSISCVTLVLFLFLVHFGCRCMWCDTSSEVEQDSALLDHHGLSASDGSRWSLRPTLELYHILPKRTLHLGRSKDATHEAKTYQNNRTKVRGKKRTILYLICSSMFGIF